ncbi:MAG: arsenate reductase ArsC [Candidatus Zixiibacteriota bacterium]|nr:MAG: arsenate reductase ArsC [candidate division Zixibacteria bacterium]
MKILVLCTGNSCRSQMAEGFFKRYFEDAGDSESASAVRSAGLEPHGVNPNAVKVMNEIGIDISCHTSNHLSEYLDEQFDYVITVCDNAAANCPTFPGDTARLHWPLDDPAAATGTEDEILDEFRRVRDEIDGKIKAWLASAEA